MRFKILRDWPVGQYVLKAGMICDRASTDYFSQFGTNFIPPPDTIPLDQGAANLLAAVYSFNVLPTGLTKEEAWQVNINNY